MASCLLGSTIFGRAAKKTDFDTQHFMYHMLITATSAMGLGVLSRLYVGTPWKSLLSLIFGFFTFEACVGMYFPVSISFQMSCLSNNFILLFKTVHRNYT